MRKVFFSFAWEDIWRVNQVRNSWVAKGGYQSAGFLDKAEIETLKKQTDETVKRWIDKQMFGTSVTCVLIGEKTAQSEWVQYEIAQSVKKGNGILGVYIHGIKNQHRKTSKQGENPLSAYPEKTPTSEKVGNALAAGGGVGLLARLVYAPIAAPLMAGAALYQLAKKDENYYQSYFWLDGKGRANLGDWIELAAQQAGK